MAIICPKCGAENTSDSNYCKSCATQLLPSEESQVSVTVTLETPKEELTTGFTFADRYQIIEELGQGGMGRACKERETLMVYLGVDIQWDPLRDDPRFQELLSRMNFPE
jgi:predicted amidophosphoribosyltransferase